jgi:hypothetical protein
MTTLRVLLAAPPASARAEPWALFDDAGRVVERGRATPDRWPSATRREAVLAASLVRVIALALPPMSASRVAARGAFALEDRLAATDDCRRSAFPRRVSMAASWPRRVAQDARRGHRLCARALRASLAEPALAPVTPVDVVRERRRRRVRARGRRQRVRRRTARPRTANCPRNSRPRCGWQRARATSRASRRTLSPAPPETLSAWRATTGVPFVSRQSVAMG